MKILVTGSNGLLGQKLVSLLDQDPTVQLFATARQKPVKSTTRGTFRQLDISAPEQVDRVVSEIKPDVLINTAGMTNVDQCETEQEECWRVNVNAVGYLAEACRKNKTHLIHLSTDFIFDGSHGPLDEEAKPGPVNFYGESKLASEKVVQESSGPWSIIRTILVYGIVPDMSRSNIVLWVKKSLEEKKTISVVNDQWRTPTLAEDLAMGCYLAARKKAQGIFHISGKDYLTPYDIAIKTAAFFGLDPSLIKATDSQKFKQPARRPLKTGFIIEKSRRELGYEPHSFDEGLALLASQIS